MKARGGKGQSRSEVSYGNASSWTHRDTCDAVIPTNRYPSPTVTSGFLCQLLHCYAHIQESRSLPKFVKVILPLAIENHSLLLIESRRFIHLPTIHSRLHQWLWNVRVCSVVDPNKIRLLISVYVVRINNCLLHTTIDWRELGIPSALPYISFRSAD